ncbi:MAG: pre-peptidase C-terminal domain-containing protein [Rhizonema sp. NSF051]|nr:pre-peptidase C-terminal domain-containing protein [Rhizonema sp. NSF051]
MFDCCDSKGQHSSLTTGLNESSTWFSLLNLQHLNDELPLVRNFSGSSADYGKFPIESHSDNIVSLSPSEPSLQVASAANSILSSVNTVDLTRPETFIGSLDNNHTSQLYSFSLSSYSSFNLSLNGLSANADVELLDGNGRRIAIDNHISNDTEWIDGSLAAGTYYANVFQHSGNTNFRLGLSATPIVNNTRTVSGTLDANHFAFQSGFNRTVISGNGNVDFGQGERDILDLSSVNSSTIALMELLPPLPTRQVSPR